MARKILLADDSVTAQNMGRKILADAGYEVITVNNGSAALKKIAEQKPDLIVLDVYMPGYSGLEVCQRLKEAQDTARIPVLLTVGKLEPFKPDEARRVGAQAFIVKPFEASELLSALAKLEDKIVPRSEPSKPGRFARAIASVEDSSRFDKTAPSDEASGWKNRISFPAKKEKKNDAEENGENPAIYNAMNRDLRTVVDSEQSIQEASASETRDDRRKKDRRKNNNEEGAGQEGLADVAALAIPGGPKDVTPDEIAAIASAAAQVQATISSATDPQQIDEAKGEVEPYGVAAVPQPQDRPSGTTDALAATQVEENIQGAHENAQEDRKVEDRNEEAVEVPANPAEVIAALASLEPVNGHSWHGVQSEDQPSYFADDVPVTMAVASGEAIGSGSPRWTAVPMAIDPEEAAVSLELEMQKAYAAFAAAEHQHSGGERPAISAETSPPVSDTEPAPSNASIPEPDLVNAVQEVASAAADAVGAAVTELAAVAESYAETQTPAALETPEFVSPDGSAIAEPSQQNEQSARAEEQTVTGEVEGTRGHESESQPEATAEIAAANEPAVDGRTKGAEKKESDLVATTAAAWASWRQIRDTGSPSGNSAQSTSDEQQHEGDEPAHSTELAAMAVAAGAESSPEQIAAAAESDPAIASIVDSMLADLRPKIVEEVSRKLGKKK